MIQDFAQRQARAELLIDSREDASGRERIAAQIEKIVLDTNLLET
jgi:hypothetical protein